MAALSSVGPAVAPEVKGPRKLEPPLYMIELAGQKGFTIKDWKTLPGGKFSYELSCVATDGEHVQFRSSFEDLEANPECHLCSALKLAPGQPKRYHYTDAEMKEMAAVADKPKPKTTLKVKELTDKEIESLAKLPMAKRLVRDSTMLLEVTLTLRESCGKHQSLIMKPDTPYEILQESALTLYKALEHVQNRCTQVVHVINRCNRDADKPAKTD